MDGDIKGSLFVHLGTQEVLGDNALGHITLRNDVAPRNITVGCWEIR
jgi:hypothetical protein